jgi:asparagine synthase (glutamine-hydrolysing)
MCGIFGHIGHIERAQAEESLKRLHHRGPDGSRLWSDDGIVLGHARLSIVDPSAAGAQPMLDRQGRYVLTFNGEMYNFLELRRDLETRGHKFQSDSDTEVLLYAYVEWGEACLPRLNGMFAFSIYDRETKDLFIARDRWGKKPLFYSQATGGFTFASEMKAILPLVPRTQVNAHLFANTHLMNTYESTSECLIREISRLPAGHSARLRNGHLDVQRWWCTLDHLIEVPTKYEDQVEMFRELFTASCRLRMRSDVPVATALSGGLDSSSVVAICADLFRGGTVERGPQTPLSAFVCSYPDDEFDEFYLAEQVAKAKHVPIERVVTLTDGMLKELYRSIYLFEEIYPSLPVPFMSTYRSVKARGISVTLDGHGGDELFGGYRHDIPVAFHQYEKNPLKKWQVMNTNLDMFAADSSLFVDKPSLARFFLRWYFDRLSGRKPLSFASRDQDHANWQRLDLFNKILYVETHETILPTLLRNYDRYSMAEGIEARAPFLDPSIVTFAFSLPTSSKIRKGFTRAIVRDAMRGQLPADIVDRKTKLGWSPPMARWMRRDFKEFLHDTSRSQDFLTCPLIDGPAVAARLQKFLNTEKPSNVEAKKVWGMLYPYLWTKAFLEVAV